MYRNIWRTSNEPQWSSIESFCAFHKLKITNSFYRHKDTNKFTWEARGTKSIIDCIIIIDRLKSNIEETSVFRGSEIDSDHKLVESKFNPYPTAFPYGNGMILHFYQQQESSTTKTVHSFINKDLKRMYSRFTLVRISIKL